MLAHQRAKGNMFMSNLIVSNFPLKVKKMNEFNVSDLLLGVLLGAIIIGLGLFYMMTHPTKQEELTLNAEPIVEQTEVEEIPEIPEELTGGHEIVEVVSETAELPKDRPSKKPILSDEELEAMVVHAEAGAEEMIGKVAVVAVILNRCDAWGMTPESVIYQKDQFAIADSYTEEDMRAVEIAQKVRDLFPSNMLYFRNQHYHTFGTPYMTIGGHFFSLEESEETE